MGFTSRAVTLKESRGNPPQTFTHFKTMTTAILLNRVTTTQIQTQDLTDDQLEMVSGGAKTNATCRNIFDPKTGISRMHCEQIKN